MAVALRQHDLEAVRTGLARWFGHRYPGGSVRVGPLTRPEAGLSSETLFVDVMWSGDGPDRADRADRADHYVARLPPAGDGLFPSYDLARQARVQATLGEATDIPVAPVVAYEPDPAFAGAPFLLLRRVPGRPLANQPPYLRKGWLHDAPPGDQRRLYDDFFAVVGRLHRLDWRRLGFDFLADGAIGLPRELDRCAHYLAWASDGSPLPELAGALAWCREHRPHPEPTPSLLWGDVQLQNCVFDDAYHVAAVLDWEMAGIGPAQLDLGWFHALHRLTVRTAGAGLPGFPEPGDSPAGNWYEVFAMVRSGAIMVRIAALLAAQGVDDSWLTRGNPAIEALRSIG